MELNNEQQAAFKQTVKGINPADEQRILSECKEAENKAKKRGASHELLDQIGMLWQMLWSPDYEISWSIKSWILGGLAYFICPVDLIPDAIPALGYVDDLAVVGWICTLLSEEIDTYRRWAAVHPAEDSWIE